MAVVTTMDWKTKIVLVSIKWFLLTTCTLGIYPIYRIVKKFAKKNEEVS